MKKKEVNSFSVSELAKIENKTGRTLDGYVPVNGAYTNQHQENAANNFAD